MDLNWLGDFECLARTLNFTRAANERNVTQSAFSRRIKALESWVGTPLINRSHYPVQLTEAGAQFLPVALAAVLQLTEQRQMIRDADRGGRRFLRFSALHTISMNFLAHRIDKLQHEIPDLHTRVISDSLSTCCDLLVEGAVDIMLCYYHKSVSPSINESAFERKDLLTDVLLPVAETKQALAQNWSLGDNSAPPIPYLAYEPSTFLGMVVDSMLEGKALNAEMIYVDGLVETIKRRVLKGSGFAWMPETAVADEMTEGRLTLIGDKTWTTRLTIAALANPASFDHVAHVAWDTL
ncbi:MAG: LysR family transcriptional regulator [Roseovarius sp.]